MAPTARTSTHRSRDNAKNKREEVHIVEIRYKNYQELATDLESRYRTKLGLFAN